MVQLRTPEDAKNHNCCVIIGQYNNFMGISDTATSGSVIDARDIFADEVCKYVDNVLLKI